MSVHFSSSLITSPSVDFPRHCPIIGWQTHVTPTNIVADSEEATGPASNLAYPDTIDVWQSASTATQYVTIAQNGSYEFLGIAGHNLAGLTLNVEGDDGGGFDDLAGSFVPANNNPLAFVFPQATYSGGVRLKITSPSEAPTIASLFAGPLLKIPRGLQTGHTPIVDAHEIRISNGIASSGNYLGGIIMHEELGTPMAISDLDPTWYRENMRDFLAYANAGLPFFWAWSPFDHPEEIGYCWFRNTPIKPVIGQRTGTMDINAQLAGIA